MKTVIFDMDGVIFDTEVVDRQAWVELGEARGLPWVNEFIYEIVGTTGAYVRERLKERLGTDGAVAEFIEAQDNYAKHQVEIKKGLLDLLEYLKANDYRVAIASSGTENWIMKNVNGAGIRNYFEIIVSGDLVTNSKPDPEIFLLACEKLGVKPQDAWVIEDSKNGIRAAREAGCKTIFIPDLWCPENPSEHEDVDYYLEDLGKVIPLLEKNENAI